MHCVTQRQRRGRHAPCFLLLTRVAPCDSDLVAVVQKQIAEQASTLLRYNNTFAIASHMSHLGGGDYCCRQKKKWDVNKKTRKHTHTHSSQVTHSPLRCSTAGRTVRRRRPHKIPPTPTTGWSAKEEQNSQENTRTTNQTGRCILERVHLCQHLGEAAADAVGVHVCTDV